MRVLITGAGGFVGKHLAKELRTHGHTPFGFDRCGAGDDCAEFVYGDLLSGGELESLITTAEPQACVHLAGAASVPRSWEDPAATFETNVGGTLRLLNLLARHQPRARILAVSSAEIYGSGRTGPLTEDALPDPANPYALSKAAADRMALLLADRQGLDVMVVRPENHIGPGQSEDFVTMAFARQVARLAAGKQETLRTGNLDSRRAFCDVRDVASAYRLLLYKGRSGQAYNLSAAPPFPVRELLDGLCALAGIAPRIETDPQRYRPTDSRPALDSRRLQEHTGWRPRYQLEDTLRTVWQSVNPLE